MTDDLVKNPEGVPGEGDPAGATVLTADEIRRQVEERVRAEEEKLPEEPDPEIDSKFIVDCLHANELGDGILFNALHRGKFVFCKSMDCWLSWKGHHWALDEMDSARAAVENVVEKYINETKTASKTIRELMSETAKTDDEDINTPGHKKDDPPEVKRLKRLRSDLWTRVSALRTMRRRENCLRAAHTCDNPLAIHGREIDQNPWLLPCVNGVVDLKSGSLLDGNPDNYMLRACPIEYNGIDVPRPTWEKTLMEIYEDDDLMCGYIQRLFGVAIIGGVFEHVFPVLTGPGGRNGKSTIIETIAYVLGPLAGPIRSEMLIDSFNVQLPSGPTPEIMALRGLRFCWASETKDGAKILAAKMKWLTGSDTLTGRSPHDKYETTFLPTHTLFLLSNFKPQLDVNDKAAWERVQNIPHNVRFIKNREPEAENERKADLYLREKLISEASGILGWLVEGCLMWQMEGLNPPPRVIQETQEYMKDEDNIGAFIQHCLVIEDGLSIGATPLYEAFEKWWHKYLGRFPPKQKKFGKQMREKFACEKTGGVYRYFGVDLNNEWSEVMSPSRGYG